MYAPMKQGEQPSVEVSKEFMMSPNKLHLEASLDKEVTRVAQVSGFLLVVFVEHMEFIQFVTSMWHLMNLSHFFSVILSWRNCCR